MKKIFIFLASAALLASCKGGSDSKGFEIAGTIDESVNGSKVFLQKQDGMFGQPVDTAVVENGKFTFEGNSDEPGLRFLTFEKLKDGRVDFILENGTINIEVNKDSLPLSKRSGTSNNDQLNDYYFKALPVRQQMMNFKKVHSKEMMEAQKSNDTAAQRKLVKEFQQVGKSLEKQADDFLKMNPDSYLSLLIVRSMAPPAKSIAEIRKAFDALNPKLKKSKEGQEFEKMLLQAEGKDTPAKNAAGKPATNFTAPNPEGKKISLNDIKGKVTIIDFWASWCKPCRMENPKVVALYNELHKDGLEIIGVSLDKDAASWKKAIADDKLAWNHVSNLKYWDEPIAKTYGVESIPATFVVDASGNIVAKDLHGEALRAKVKELLAK